MRANGEGRAVNRDLLHAALGRRPADLLVTGGTLVDVFTEEIYPADVAVSGSRIVGVGDVGSLAGEDTQLVDASGFHLVPGLIDGHLHLECSKLSVSMFANAVVPFGTTSVISGLDQIFVVAGLAGVREFLDEAATTALKVLWGAPSKLPYTVPESTIGYDFTPEEHRVAQSWPECVAVWETVQEFIFEEDEKVFAALEIAAGSRIPVFGCAPLARGSKVWALMCAGVRGDHECYSAEECLEKLRSGMFLMIRESSVAHFLDENIRVLTEYGVKTDRVAFCTDDVTAADVLEKGHVDRLVRMAIERGLEPIKAIQMATINCAQMYRIDQLVGSISPGREADILMVDDLRDFRVARVISKGRPVAEAGRMTAPASAPARSAAVLETFRVGRVGPEDLLVRAPAGADRVRVLSMVISDDVPFVRKGREVVLDVREGAVQADVAHDVLYACVVERFGRSSNRPVAFISGFGLQEGAMASSASPDDNNILCIGTNPSDMAHAINRIIEVGGGQAVVRGGEDLAILPLPIGGIVADLEPERMAQEEVRLDDAARTIGCRLALPFMYMIFLSVTAIPDYAMTDRGLVDCVNLRIVDPVLEAVE